MSAPGWIKVHRALLDHWCATEPEALAVWVRLLCEANFDSKKSMINGCLIEVERGQLVFGLDAFSKKSGVSVAKLRRIISMLESDGMISRQKTSKYSLISISCYDKCHEDDRQIAGKSKAKDNQIAAPKEVKNLRSKETDLSPETDDHKSSKLKNNNCPQKSILSLWAQELPECTQPRVWDDARAKSLSARWKEDPERQSLDYWKNLFGYIRRSDFLMGRTQQDKPFRIGLDWVIKAANFAKIIEGKYH